MINKILFAITVVFICFGSLSANCQVSGKKVIYNFTEPYFSGEDISNFFNSQINLKRYDFNQGIKGMATVIFKLTKDKKIENFKVLDSTTNKNFNKQFYDAILNFPGRWEVAKINDSPVDIMISVSTNISSQDGDGGFLFASYTYLIDNLLSTNFYNEGVKLSSENKFSEAIKYFDEVLKISPDDVDGLFNRGICKYKSDDKAGACEDWKKIQSLGKPDADKLILKYCGN